MGPQDFAFALRTVARLFAWRGPPLVLFWIAWTAQLDAPTPLAAALGLHLVLRIGGNLARMRQAGRAIPRAVWPFVLAMPVLTLFPSDGLLMVAWPGWMACVGLMLWRARFMREVEQDVRPAPIAETGLWQDMRGAVLLATAGLGLLLSLTGDPAVWITGCYLGGAALDLTGLLYLRARGKV